MFLQRYVIIVATAFGGAWTMIVGAAGRDRAIAARGGGIGGGRVDPVSDTPAPGRAWVPIAWVLLGLIGTGRAARGDRPEEDRRTSYTESALANLAIARRQRWRHSNGTWTWTGQGSVMEGKGEAKAGTGAFSLPVTFPSRIGDPAGKTSPEELMAAAHAACYAMALNGTLGRTEGVSVERTTVRGDDHGRQRRSRHQDHVVKARGDRVRAEGRRCGEVRRIAKLAESRCPVSNAYRGTMQITLDAKVA